VEGELRRLRQGIGLADTKIVAAQTVLHQLICGPAGPADSANQVARIQQAVRAAINDLIPDLQQYALVDFNLDASYDGETLTLRQQKLATKQGRVPKTVQRHADKAIRALAVAIASRAGPPSSTDATLRAAEPPAGGRSPGSWQEVLCAFWGLKSGGSVDVVCSEIPEALRPSYASPAHHNFLFYARFVDLDSLIYAGRSFLQAQPTVDIRELQPSQYGRRGANPLLVLGGPPYNRVFREHQNQLQVFEFEEHPAGEDDPLVVKPLANRKFGPRWTGSNELLTDVSVFVRLTFERDSRVFLAAGCLTLGVHGAARCFLHGADGARNVRYIQTLAEDRDFVLVAEVGHDGPGRTPVVPDFTKTAPLLLIARDAGGGFGDILVDNTEGKDYQEL
jgi:hypothetical protein